MAESYNFFLKADLSPFIGEWIAIADNRILSHRKSLKETYEEAKKKTTKNILLTRVPDKEEMIL
ncbi:succinyl-CoA synthetase subunit alpha [Candidatus Micrarchaeota archaeon]|jgi:hypothetical protein|nr:succinyl-CoA synthetase subunit alpha [Candidatus Micrarchaeota archaeon]